MLTLKTVEDFSKFIGGRVSESSNLVVNLDDGTVLDFSETINGVFVVNFKNKTWRLEFNEKEEKRLHKLYAFFEGS